MADGFRCHARETLAGLRLAFTTLGERGAPAVLLPHGAGGSARSPLAPAFAGELFGPGQPLDAGRHFLVLPDSLGHGGCAKPSDGLRARFPRHNLADTVEGHRRVVADALGVARMRLVRGERGNAGRRRDGPGAVLARGAAALPGGSLTQARPRGSAAAMTAMTAMTAMPAMPATAILLATLAAGAVAGFHHLGRSRKRAVVWAHLSLALAALAAVLLAGASPLSWPALLLAAAVALGWGAGRVWRRGSARGGQAMLVGHVFVGVASFFAFLAWAARAPG